MAELKDKELNEVNGGKAQMEAWELVFSEEQTIALNPAIDKKDIPTDEETWLA